MYFNIPLMLINTLGCWFCLQIHFLGMFRPESEEAKQHDLGEKGERIVKKVIVKRLKELGPISQVIINVEI